MSGKGYRRLTEEIVKVLQHIYKAGADGELPKEPSDVYAQQFVARVGKAIIETGELDEALGIVGRELYVDNMPDLGSFCEGLPSEGILIAFHSRNEQ